MLLWKGRFPSIPSLIILEVDGAPHQDGSPGTTACHQMIFHPKSCCFHCWSYWGRSRSEQGKPAQPLPGAPAVCREGGAASPGSGAPASRRAGTASSAPAPNPSRDTGSGRLLPRQRSPASRSPCCLSQGVTQDSNLTHRTIPVSRCFSRQR